MILTDFIAVRVTAKDNADLNKLAFEKEISKSEIIRDGITLILKDYKRSDFNDEFF